MPKQEKVLRELCLQVAKGDVRGDRFNELLLETGIYLDNHEWETANRLLSESDRLFFSVKEEVTLH